LVVIQRKIIPRIKQVAREVTQATVRISKEVVENLQGLRLIHSFGRQRETIATVRQRAIELVPLLEKQQRLTKITNPLNQLLTITIVGLLLILGYLILSNEEALLIPALFTFIAALQRLSNQLGSFAQVANQLAQNSGNMDRLNEILTTEDKEWEKVGGKVFQGVAEKI
ncbi:MAG: ABC transporter transmembrane domain-containing protein, partial [Halothece sp.]